MIVGFKQRFKLKLLGYVSFIVCGVYVSVVCIVMVMWVVFL